MSRGNGKHPEPASTASHIRYNAINFAQMAKVTPTTRKAVIQRLESLRRAGVAQLPKPRKKAAPPQTEEPRPAAIQMPATVAPHSQCGQPCVSATEGGEILVAASSDSRCAALARVAAEVALCRRCQELARTRTQTVFGVGNPYSQLVFCGEAPGADEDRQGEPFVGRAGQLLTDIIVKGMKLRREDIYILNILRCRPPNNRTPLPEEAANCREFLDRQLAIIQPKFICCLGACAAQNLLGSDQTIGRLRGRIHDHHGIKVVCTYHPAYLLRNPPAKRYVWEDIQMLMAEMNLPK